MKTKMIPVLIMLIAASITSIITYVLHYPLKTMLWVLLVVLLVFYAAGCIVAAILDKFEKENESTDDIAEKEEIPGEGAVVEKEMSPEEQESAGEEV